MARTKLEELNPQDFVNEDGYSINPFIQTLSIKVNHFKDRNSTKEIEMEAQHYTKVFTSAFTRKIKMGFTSITVCKLYTYIEEDLTPAKDYIKINPESFMRESKTNDIRSYDKAINELCAKGIIYRHHKHLNNVFWINPKIFFSGSRLRKFYLNIES